MGDIGICTRVYIHIYIYIYRNLRSQRREIYIYIYKYAYIYIYTYIYMGKGVSPPCISYTFLITVCLLNILLYYMHCLPVYNVSSYCDVVRFET